MSTNQNPKPDEPAKNLASSSEPNIASRRNVGKIKARLRLMDKWSIGAKKLASGQLSRWDQLSTDPEILHLASEPSFDVSNARLPDAISNGSL